MSSTRPMWLDVCRTGLFSTITVSGLSCCYWTQTLQYEPELKERIAPLVSWRMAFYGITGLVLFMLSVQPYVYKYIGSKLLIVSQLSLLLIGLGMTIKIYQEIIPLMTSSNTLEHQQWVLGSCSVYIVSSALWLMFGFYSYLRYTDPHDVLGYVTTSEWNAPEISNTIQSTIKCATEEPTAGNTMIFYFSESWPDEERETTRNQNGMILKLEIYSSNINVVDYILKRKLLQQPESNWFIQKKTKEVRAYLEQSTNVILVGHSYGGFIACKVAEALNQHSCSERIQLITLGSLYIPRSPIQGIRMERHYLFLGDIAQRINQTDEPTLEEWVKNGVGPYHGQQNIVWAISPLGVPDSLLKDINDDMIGTLSNFLNYQSYPGFYEKDKTATIQAGDRASWKIHQSYYLLFNFIKKAIVIKYKDESMGNVEIIQVDAIQDKKKKDWEVWFKNNVSSNKLFLDSKEDQGNEDEELYESEDQERNKSNISSSILSNNEDDEPEIK